MSTEYLSAAGAGYLQQLCIDIPTRRVGSAGNQAAVDFFAQKVASFGFKTEFQPFDCMDWANEGAELTMGGTDFPISSSPYSPGCQVSGSLAVVSSVEELSGADVSGSILLLRGEIAQEPLMPRNFPFYSPEEHQRIYRLLDEKQPLAVITATPRSPMMAGGVYPCPMFEDGDFDIPSVYLSAEDGERLAEKAGRAAALTIRARRIPSTGANVIARKGDPARRVVFTAHIDAKAGSPGAADNAAGVTVLLLLAELLKDYRGNLGVELAAINGEDYYSNPGEQKYLECSAGGFEQIILGVNIDGAGYTQGNTAYSLYECTPELAEIIQAAVNTQPGLIPGEPWYQGDHGLFLMNGRPALAFTTENVWDLMLQHAHTAGDSPEIVDPDRLARLALTLRELVDRLN